MFAARYGYDIETFYSLTLRQIYVLKKVIERERREDIRQKAALHGKELKNDLPEPLMVDDETEKDRDKQRDALMERMKQRQKARQHGERQRTTDTDKREC